MNFDSSLIRLALVFVVVLGFGGGVTAQDAQPPWAAETGAELAEIAADHNAVVDQVAAGPVATLLRNERVTLFVSDTDGSEAVFSFRTDASLRLVELRPGARDDATTHLFTDRATLTRLADAPDRGSVFEAAVRAGDIRIVGVSPLNRALWGLVALGLWALASPGQAVVAAAATVAGLGAVVVVASKVIGGGSVLAGSASATASAGTTGVGGGSTGATTGTGAGTTGTGSAGGGAGAASEGTTAAGTDTPPMLAQTAGNSLEAGNTLSTGSVNPVGIADRLLSFFERLLFIVAIVKKLGGRLRRSLGGVVDRLLSREAADTVAIDGGAEAVADAVESRTTASVEHARSPSRRRRPSPRRRRR